MLHTKIQPVIIKYLMPSSLVMTSRNRLYVAVADDDVVVDDDDDVVGSVDGVLGIAVDDHVDVVDDDDDGVF